MKTRDKIFTLALTCIILCSFLISVSAINIGDVVNHTVYTDIVAKINGYDIASFNIDGYTAVVAEDLRNYGFTVNWVDSERALYITLNPGTAEITSTYKAPFVSQSQVGAKACDVLYTDIKTYIEGQLVKSHNIGGQTAIYFDDLASYGNVSFDNSTRILSLNVPELSTSVSLRGSRSNPYFANDGAVISFNKWSHEPVRNISVVCTNVIRGVAANSLVRSENQFNDSPTSDQEWIFFEFDINYISSSDGENDEIDASDIIYESNLYTSTGASLIVHDMASFAHKYSGCGIFDVSLFPGSRNKVVYAVLINKGVGDIYLSVPDKSNDKIYWINCTKTK